VEKIFYKNTLIAIKFKKFKKGAMPITDPMEPLQLVAFKHPEGKYTKAHIHKPRKRITQRLQECLVMIKGKIKIDLYSPDKKFFKSIYLSQGQAAILMNGGHAVSVLKNSEILEFKNGPFVEDKNFIE
jgi:hypothetical protein